MSNPIRWRRQTADYTTAERLLMADLPVREQAFVHTLKALTQGEISSARIAESTGDSGRAEVSEVNSDQPSVSVTDAVSQLGPLKPSESAGGRIGRGRGSSPHDGIVYTDPEDIEFGSPNDGAPKARAKIYAVVWTGGNHRRCKTKDGAKDRRSATKTIKTWLRWYERQGWKVTFGSQAAGWYIAANEKGDRHAISLHVYDSETLERTN